MYYVDRVAFRNTEAARQRALNPFPKTWVVRQRWRRRRVSEFATDNAQLGGV